MATKAATKKMSEPDKDSVVPTKKTADKRVSTTEDENWDRRLGFLMHDVSRLRRMVFDDYVKHLGITRSQWWVLIYLARHDGMTQTDLAGLLDLGKAALGGLVDRLEESGAIERRADSSDRRAKRIFLTNQGNRTIKEMQGVSHDMSERILEGLDEAERVQLADLLGRVKKNLVALKAARSIVE